MNSQGFFLLCWVPAPTKINTTISRFFHIPQNRAHSFLFPFSLFLALLSFFVFVHDLPRIDRVAVAVECRGLARDARPRWRQQRQPAGGRGGGRRRRGHQQLRGPEEERADPAAGGSQGPRGGAGDDAAPVREAQVRAAGCVRVLLPAAGGGVRELVGVAVQGVQVPVPPQ